MNYGRRLLAVLLVTATVLLNATALIHLSHESAIRYPDDTFLVTCKDEGGRPVAWSGPRGALGAKTHPKVATASYGTSIYFTKITPKDSGNYTCNAGQDKKRFHLVVEAPLTFMDTSPVQTGREYTDVNLRCEVKAGGGASDKPFVTWSIEKGNLNGSKYEVIGDGLLIRNVTRTDSKTYICKAMQTSTGDIREQRIQLKVEHKPVLHPHWAKEKNSWGFIGGDVNLTCAVEAEPPPTFEWMWKKQTVDDDKIYTYPHKSILQVHIKDATTFGTYKCLARNKIGTLEEIFVLQQGIRASPPEYIDLRGANSDLLDVGIQGPENAEKVPALMSPKGFRVEFRPREENHWQYKDFPISEDNSYPLKELKHDTEYEVRAATRNQAGISVYTNTSIFRTLTSQTDAAATHPIHLLLPLIPALLVLSRW